MKNIVSGNLFNSSSAMNWKSRVNMLVDAGNYASAITFINGIFPKAQRDSAVWHLLADIHSLD